MAKTLKTGVSTPPFLAAIAAVGDKRSCEEALANNQKRGAETKDENILSALAALSERLELWGKARRYYQMANALRPNHRYVQALAELERKSSESTSARDPENQTPPNGNLLSFTLLFLVTALFSVCQRRQR